MATCTKCGALVAPSISLAPVCTNCGGIAALYGRPVYPPPPDRAEIIRERIAQADSYLNDVNLPTYGELVQALRAADRYVHVNPDGIDLDHLLNERLKEVE